jgi:hypothetical protein
VVDIDLIERIYGIFYRQKVSGIARHAFRTLTTIEKATATERGIELAVRNNATGEVTVRVYDAVVLATGYERQMHRKLLAPLEAYLGDFEVDRNYKLITDERCKAGIYMQGFCQASHGLSDTLLSILPIRADEIAGSLYEHGKQPWAQSFGGGFVVGDCQLILRPIQIAIASRLTPTMFCVRRTNVGVSLLAMGPSETSKIFNPEPFLKNPAFARPTSSYGFTLKTSGRKLRAFSSIAETHSGYLFE